MATPPTITRVQLGGSSDPTFVIKDGETYYVTQSVATYDLKQAKSDQEKADVEALIRIFEAAKKAGDSVEAVKLPKSNNVMSFQQTWFGNR
ncbi:hypothetical protein [Sphingosinicella microcystinivorans]|uniref:hypothetical protein n=1 Tax=Sphingosinicella microcystinivorans TaxID=335406 RepID=UPI0022F396EC|nr:hypothetical protein [Sphingosinicella microcystinivorans]WBX85441.1 hypothetical protein PE061_05820 [Sphingosinicella microcystinivorans]